MAEEPKQFDPEATVAQPLGARDSDATVAGPLMAPEADPEKTVDGPLFKAATGKGEPDPEATDRHTVFDPDATMNPMERATLDPEATVRVPSSGRIRLNPFAPKGMPESIQANLSSLGGLNSLVAIANPILGAVPQIRRALKHPDPVMLRSNLRDQIESFESSAMSAEISDETSNAAVYALCALLDESAAATPWGASWIEKGLLLDMRGEAGGGEGFFALLDKAAANPEANADLLEFFYVCLALGFEGRYRKIEDGKRLGADEVVISKDDAQMQRHINSFDFILNTVAVSHNLDAFTNLLRTDGTMCLVGAPEHAHPSPMVWPLIMKRASIAGSAIGGIPETQEMLDFCAQHNIASDIEIIPIQKITEAYGRMLKSDVKYRFVIDMASLK